MRDIEAQPYTEDEARVAKFFADAGAGGGDDPIGTLLACHAYAMQERNRFREGLNIIAQAGTVHGGAWCVAQAYGYLNDLDFDQFPETGNPPRS